MIETIMSGNAKLIMNTNEAVPAEEQMALKENISEVIYNARIRTMLEKDTA